MCRTVVGVVPDLRQRARPAKAEPLVYVPVLEAPPATGCCSASPEPSPNRAIPSSTPDLTVTNPLVLGTVMLVLTLVTLVACLAPVGRATRLDPASVLRED